MDQITTLPAPPARTADGHKGTFGTVLVVGGCFTMPGAPALCASAAFRAGVGLVKILATREVLQTALTIEPGATGTHVDPAQRTARLSRAVERADPSGSAVVALGPGLGRSAGLTQAVRRLLHGPRTVVLDADGLNALADLGQTRPPEGGPTVMTPHPGEFRRLARAVGLDLDDRAATDPAQRVDAAGALARRHDAVVVLKGAGTVVTDGRRFAVNTTGNPALATAGSGDVLTGLIAALIAQGLSPMEAAVLGAHLHGLAADRWADRHGPGGSTAQDLARELPDAFEQVRRDAST